MQIPCVYLPGPAPAVSVANNGNAYTSDEVRYKWSYYALGHHWITSTSHLAQTRAARDSKEEFAGLCWYYLVAIIVLV